MLHGVDSTRRHENRKRPYSKSCRCARTFGKDVTKIFGHIQYVTALADYKVEVVTALEDLRVQEVSALANSAGKWQIVTALPDFKIQKVKALGDFKIKYVTALPGTP